MSTAPVLVLNVNPGSTTSPYTTASFTPVAGTRLIVHVYAFKATAGIVKPIITDSASLTWTELGNVKTSTFSNPDIWLVGWVSSVIPSSPAAMTVTVTDTAATGLTSSILSVLAADTDGTVIQTAYGEDLTAGKPSFTFAATPGASNIVIGATGMSGANSITGLAGYTSLFNLMPTNMTARRTACFYDTTSAAKGPNALTSTNVRSVVMAVELGITAAPAGRIKVWNGSAWVVKPSKAWTGAAWVAKPAKKWTGSAWVS